jgi:tRNA(adenine34) deaminase
MEFRMFSDEYFMREALKEARVALEKGEIPVGAVIVSNDHIIARAHNNTETLNDFTAHAEMQAYTAAANYIGSKFLNDCTLYVTLEPCSMCAGASMWTRVGKIVFGAWDDKKGYHLYSDNLLHPKTEIITGILHEECAGLLQDFFIKKR